MSIECQRWIELSDQEALGAPLSEEARQFQRTHAATCADCMAEARVWLDIRAPRSEPPPSEREIEAILSGVRRSSSSVQHPRRRFPPVAFAAAVVACAAAVAFWFRVHTPQKNAGSSDHFAVSQTSPRNRPEAAESTETGSDDLAGPSCSETVPGVELCLAPESELAAKNLSGPHRSVRLARGRAVVSLVPQAPGTTFSVTTQAGRVTAVGTIFSVEITPDGPVVRVVRGRVLVHDDASDRSRPLSAGEMLRIGDDKPTPLPGTDRDNDLGTLPAPWRSESEGSKDAGSSSSSVGRAAVASPEQLLEQAQTLRAQGEFRKAANLYAKISELSPTSSLGRSSLVASGELLLSLNDAHGALNAFNSYLSHSGPLAREASFGKIRALRALKRANEERREIQRFLATYPDAPQSRVLRGRLSEHGE